MKRDTPIDQLERAAQLSPHARIHCDDRSFSYQDLYNSSLRCAGALQTLGITAGDRIALWLPNGRAYLDLLYACMHLNAIAVAVNTRYRSSEVASILHRTGAKAVAVSPGFNGINYLSMLSEIDKDAVADLKVEIICNDDRIDVALSQRARVSYNDIVSNDAIESMADADMAAAIFSTSGTTNLPKFPVHEQGSIALHAQQVSDVCKYDEPGTHLLQAIPFCGIFGFSQWIATVAGGASCTVLSIFDAQKAGEVIRERNISHVHGPDDLLKRLLDAYPDEKKPFPSLKNSVYAGFNPTLATFPEEAEKRGFHLIGAFGMSEIYSFVSLWPNEASLAIRARSGGFLVNPDALIRSRDVTTGALLDFDQVGELELKSSTLFSGYFADDVATKAAFTDDNYFRTGDLGAVAEDGSFRFFGRNGDFLRLGGFLVNPVEIEAIIQQDPNIETAIVVEVATSRGNKAVAFVKLTDAAAFDAFTMRNKIMGKLADFKIPAKFIAIDSFPTTMGPNGEKIQRSKVKVLATKILAEDVA